MDEPPPRDLTDATSWDAIWRRAGGGTEGARSALRARLPWVRALDTVLVALLDRAAPRGAGGIDVLELGCAPGAMLERMHRLRPQHRYHGLDIAAAGLAVAAARLTRAGISARLAQGDLRTADPGAGVDLVVSFGLIEHFSDPAEVVAGHARFARPGGAVAITVPNYAHPAVAWLLARVSPETLATHNLEVMSPTALARALSAAGLVAVEAGTTMGPVLPSSRPRPGPLGAAYGAGARLWNLVAPSIPGAGQVLWDGLIWAAGRRPAG